MDTIDFDESFQIIVKKSSPFSHIFVRFKVELLTFKVNRTVFVLQYDLKAISITAYVSCSFASQYDIAHFHISRGIRYHRLRRPCFPYNIVLFQQ